VRLVAAITPHGYGHAAQLAPVLDALARRCPALRLGVLTDLPEAFLRERIGAPFEYHRHAPDFGLHMKSALEVDLERSARAYREQHADWPARVDAEARRLAALAPDLVLADVPAVILAAADVLGVPAVALCSLNWADIYRHYFADRPEAAGVLAQLEAAYGGARLFLCPEPSMPMPWLARCRTVGPIARRGRDRRAALVERLGLAPQTSLVLVAPGGVGARFPVEDWPPDAGIHWLVADDWRVDHPAVSTLGATGMPFIDLLASADAVLGKCGYGTVAECVVNGTPLLYVPRPDWPEERWLAAWLARHRAGVPLPAARLADGAMRERVDRCRALAVRRVEADGAAQAADRILALVGTQARRQPMRAADGSADREA